MVRWLLPNGSRLSCGRNARWRKALESQRKETRGRGNAALPYLRAPGSFKRLLGGSRSDIVNQRPCLEKKASHASTTRCAQVRESNRVPSSSTRSEERR